MFWKRKKDEQKSEQPSATPQTQINYQFVPPQPQQAPMSFVVDEQRHKAVMAILQGRPYFAVYLTDTEIKTVSAVDRRSLAAGLKAMARQNPTFAEDLLNIVIDIHTQNGTKTAAERETDTKQ